jgi:aspartyl-tRNA(Asn)/glutamyl-tRNA(Gln) amidotransferase subunit B
VANWVTNELSARLAADAKDFSGSPVPAAHIAPGRLIEDGTSRRQDRQGGVRPRLERRGLAREVVEKHGLKQVTDTGAIEKAVDEIIAANPDKAAASPRSPRPSAGSSAR